MKLPSEFEARTLEWMGEETYRALEAALQTEPPVSIRVNRTKWSGEVAGEPVLWGKNDELRGHAGGFDKGLRTLLTLKGMGVKDIGFGCTVSNNNSKDMLSLYQLSKSLGMEFATAAFHNSYYFHKGDNVITNKDEVCKNFGQLIEWQLKEKHPKSWFRAFFNMGLINYIEGGRRMLPCEAGSANFFIEPYGDIYPCNGLEEKYWMKKMGNIRETPDFMDIWNSKHG